MNPTHGLDLLCTDAGSFVAIMQRSTKPSGREVQRHNA